MTTEDIVKMAKTKFALDLPLESLCIEEVLVSSINKLGNDNVSAGDVEYWSQETNSINERVPPSFEASIPRG